MKTLNATAPAVPGATTRIAAGLFALTLGGFLVWGAGLANAQTLHDTAHDMRHAFGFPCH